MLSFLLPTNAHVALLVAYKWPRGFAGTDPDRRASLSDTRGLSTSSLRQAGPPRLAPRCSCSLRRSHSAALCPRSPQTKHLTPTGRVQTCACMQTGLLGNPNSRRRGPDPPTADSRNTDGNRLFISERLFTCSNASFRASLNFDGSRSQMPSLSTIGNPSTYSDNKAVSD